MGRENIFQNISSISTEQLIPLSILKTHLSEKLKHVIQYPCRYVKELPIGQMQLLKLLTHCEDHFSCFTYYCLLTKHKGNTRSWGGGGGQGGGRVV